MNPWYGRRPTGGWSALSPEEQRLYLLGSAGITLALTFAWCLAMFWTRRPAVDDFCILAFTPLILAAAWGVIAWKLVALLFRGGQPRRLRLVAVALLAFLLAPYSYFRAGSDMFTLSVRYHLWRAGGAEKVRAAFERWVAGRPYLDATNGRKLLFGQAMPGGSIVPLPGAQLPPEVRYIHERFPSRFGMTWNDVTDLDYVSALTTTDIMFGQPGWQPDGGIRFRDRLFGFRRKLADGVWIQFGVYAK